MCVRPARSRLHDCVCRVRKSGAETGEGVTGFHSGTGELGQGGYRVSTQGLGQVCRGNGGFLASRRWGRKSCVTVAPAIASLRH